MVKKIIQRFQNSRLLNLIDDVSEAISIFCTVPGCLSYIVFQVLTFPFSLYLFHYCKKGCALAVQTGIKGNYSLLRFQSISWKCFEHEVIGIVCLYARSILHLRKSQKIFYRVHRIGEWLKSKYYRRWKMYPWGRIHLSPSSNTVIAVIPQYSVCCSHGHG